MATGRKIVRSCELIREEVRLLGGERYLVDLQTWKVAGMQ